MALALWSKAKKLLGVLTDLLLIGRAKQWWEKGQGPNLRDKPGPKDFGGKR